MGVEGDNFNNDKGSREVNSPNPPTPPKWKMALEIEPLKIYQFHTTFKQNMNLILSYFLLIMFRLALKTTEKPVRVVK